MSYVRIDFAGGSIGRCAPTPQGGIVVPAFLTKPGIFAYTDENGNVIREFRPPDEVFDPDTMASLRDAPVTLGHPPPERPVVTTNWRELAVGHARGDARIESDMVAADLVIQDAAAIRAIENGVQEVSCGYRFESLDNTPGEWNGQAYDRIQRGIRYNHIALVRKGRAGSDVRLRLDSEDNQITEIDEMTTPAIQTPPPVPAPAQDATAVGTNLPAETSMQTPASAMPAAVVTGDTAPGAPPAAPGGPAPAVPAQDAVPAAPDLAAQVQALTEQVATLQAQLSTIQAEKARADADHVRIRTSFNAAVSARVALERAAAPVLGETVERDGKPVRLDSLTDRELRIAVIHKIRHDDVSTLAARDDQYLTGMADVAIADHAKGRRALTPRAGSGEGRQDAAPASGREKMRADRLESSRQPLAVSKDK